MSPYLRTQFCPFADAIQQLNEDASFILEYEEEWGGEFELIEAKGEWLADAAGLTLRVAGQQKQQLTLNKKIK